MPKYLLEVSYTAQGTQGLLKDGGTKRRAAATAGVASLGGTIEAFYYAFGKHDVVVIVDVPDAQSAAALSLALGASGAVSVRTTALLTAEDLDAAAGKAATANYTPPGR